MLSANEISPSNLAVLVNGWRGTSRTTPSTSHTRGLLANPLARATSTAAQNSFNRPSRFPQLLKLLFQPYDLQYGPDNSVDNPRDTWEEGKDALVTFLLLLVSATSLAARNSFSRPLPPTVQYANCG